SAPRRVDDGSGADRALCTHPARPRLAGCAISVPRRQFCAAGEEMHDFPACQATCIPCRPESRGWLRIRSPDPAAPPAIQPNYLSTQADKDTLIAGLRIARGIFQTAAMQKSVSEEFLPGPQAESDEDWLAHIRETAGTTYHPTSTCMMGPHD